MHGEVPSPYRSAVAGVAECILWRELFFGREYAQRLLLVDVRRADTTIYCEMAQAGDVLHSPYLMAIGSGCHGEVRLCVEASEGDEYLQTLTYIMITYNTLDKRLTAHTVSGER